MGSSMCPLLAALNAMGPGEGTDGQAVEHFLGIPVTAEGKARARRQLDAARDRHNPQARAEFLSRIGMDPNRPVRRLFRFPRPSGYAGRMRRPDIELTDEAAAFVEQHPDVIARLAGQEPEPAGVPSDAARERFRGYIRERLDAARSGELRGAGQAFLARYAAR
jgi:hypothetical protein